VITVAAHLQVELTEPDADTEELADLAHQLRLELLQLDVDAVQPIPAGPAPPGSKGVELAAVAALLVQLQGSVAAVAAIVSTVRSWLQRGRTPPGRTVTITVEGHTLELSAATDAQQEELVQAFLRTLPAPET
jgi:hypothetical protein